MKILVITNLYPPRYLGGYELGCKDVVEGLRSRGNIVTVLTSAYGLEGLVSEQDVLRNLEHFWGDYPAEDLAKLSYIQSVRSKWVSPKNYRLVIKVIKQEKPEIAYAWGLDRISPLSVLSGVKKMGVPTVIHLMDDWLYQAKIQNLYPHSVLTGKVKKLVKQKIDDFYHGFPLIVMSQSLEEDYVSHGFPAGKMFLVPPALPVSRSSLLPVKPLGDQFKILYAGQIGEWKGVHDIVKALMEIKKRETGITHTLDIIGEGAPGYIKFLTDLVVEYGLETRVNFMGKQDRDTIYTIMHNYDSLVFPTLRKEPFGFVVLEAMNAGVPVIASAQGGPLELVTPYETGLLFEPGNHLELAESILYLSKNPQIRQQVRDNAFQMVRQSHDFNKYINSIEEILVGISKEGL